jgi:hypothetical protein
MNVGRLHNNAQIAKKIVEISESRRPVKACRPRLRMTLAKADG